MSQKKAPPLPLIVLSPSSLKIFPLIVFNVSTYKTIEQDLRFRIVFFLFFFSLLSFQSFAWVPLLITGILLGYILLIKKGRGITLYCA